MCKVTFIIIHHYISKPIRGSSTRCIAFTLDIDHAVACQPSLHENNYRTQLSIFFVNNICETRAFQQVHALRMCVTTMKLVKMSKVLSNVHNLCCITGQGCKKGSYSYVNYMSAVESVTWNTSSAKTGQNRKTQVGFLGTVLVPY